jgi:hypothetical protein
MRTSAKQENKAGTSGHLCESLPMFETVGNDTEL